MPIRRAAKIDKNQNDIVDALRKIPGITVEVGHDDILVGCMDRQGIPRTYWFEIKDIDTVSKKTGQVRNSELKPSQKILIKKWLGQYDIVTSLDDILKVILKK